MSRANRSADVGVATSQELLRAALARSARRGARVATWRVGMRWLIWGLGKGLRYAGLASVAIAPLALAWWIWPSVAPHREQAALPTAVATTSATATAPAAVLPQASEPPAARPSAAVDPSADTPPPGTAVQAPAELATGSALRLRLDESVTPPVRPTPAPGPAREAQSVTKPNDHRPTPE